MPTTFELKISNTTAHGRVFCLEPWGGRYELSPNTSLRVVIESPSSPILEWEHGDDTETLIVHDPAGAQATVYDGEKPVRAE